MSLFAEGSFSAPATDDSSHIASSSSTPPTTVADSASLHSDSSKHEETITVADEIAPAALPPVTAEDVPSPRRARRARAFSPVYNLSKLSGTSAHGWRRSKGDAVADRRRRRTIPGDTPMRSVEDGAGADDQRDGSAASSVAARGTIDALLSPLSSQAQVTPSNGRQARASPRGLRSSSRLSGANGVIPLSLTASLSAASKRSRNRSRKSIEAMLASLPLELRRLQDTKEFARIDDVPVVHTVWSNGKFVDSEEAVPVESPARKKTRVATPEEEIKVEDAPEPITQVKRQRVAKKYLTKGLYAGQEYPKDVTRCLSTAEKKELAQYPELKPRDAVNKAMPLPIFTGLRLLLNGRDFKLPYNVCNPLPPGQPKPDEWKKMTKNRFIGGSKEIWRKLPHINDYQSKCVCKPEDGCGESCQNRIMLYECDETNCNVGRAHCTNRAFADLTARRTKGGKYRVGVEVIKTPDRGYGVRSNRCFEPHQIIMEYTGEIITEEECERRMNEIYKDNECYYLMSFDQNMIIDATTGSIARFVNHSCNPNCRMIKWIVSGQPRMALFAGDRPIMTGDELTYDYNFDPFSAKNVQKCLCGQPNCRGVLGPRPREVRQSKAEKTSASNSNNSSSGSGSGNGNGGSGGIKKAIKATLKAGKRKLKESMADKDEKNRDEDGNTKKRKVAAQSVLKRKRKDKKEEGKKQKQKSQNKSKSMSKTLKSLPTCTAGAKSAKGAAAGMRKGLSTSKNPKPSTTKKTTATASSTSKSRKTATATLTATRKTASTKRIIQTYGSGSRAKMAKTKTRMKADRAMSPMDEPVEIVKDAILVKEASPLSAEMGAELPGVSPRRTQTTKTAGCEVD
ncbi:Histone-lysine N-methyltransferase ASH1L [Escovopsis weberi]|uniref:Histone-lysine N-methyltransferase ASH1L n=1 Tax=Escovopsis weberi TaxID=150374 RepID=A0A0M8MYH8_ESCWE|nr:Histone-lysine N-methyltransferase ASH1L [Escovopsis weberi]